MKFLKLFVLSIFVASCSSPTGRNLANQSYFNVLPEQGFEEDRQLVSELLSQDIPGLLYFFGKDTSTIMSTIPYSITIQDKANEEVYEGQAMLSSGTRDGQLKTYYANLRILALSKYKDSGKTLTNDPHDVEFFRKLMIHEYSTVVADVLMRNKEGGGWRFFNAPAWFVEGFPEFLAFSISGEENKKRFLKLKKMADGESKLLENPYIMGPLFIQYLIGEHGRAKFLNFIYSSKATFQEAFVAVFGETHHRMIKKFETVGK
jgi:hypothetical protein